MMEPCKLCPRRCGADRTLRQGLCGADLHIKVARAMPHFWEEPCISGTRGSGAVFFSGCTLRCGYCQNYEISSCGKGEPVTLRRLEEILFDLKEQGVHNINLVTADQYVMQLAPLLRQVKKELALPVVFNCSGYESEEMLALLADLVDVYLVDYKYADNALGMKYSGVPDYADTVQKALPLMLAQVGKPRFDEDGMMTGGVIVRHLILPSERKNALSVLASLHSLFSCDEFLLSLMSQFTPNGREGTPKRTLTRFEYDSVSDFAIKLGFKGYFQEFSSQSSAFTPTFDGKGVTK